MQRYIVLSFACVMAVVGLFGFLFGHVGYVVQFDPFQSFLYLVIGASGLYLATSQGTHQTRQRYLRGVAVFNLGLLALGLTWPNFRDVIHLEIPEHIFHGIVGLAAAILSDRTRNLVT